MRLFLLVSCLLFAVAAHARSLDGDEAAGRALFVDGRGAAGPVMATLGTGEVAVPAASVPCASCHGRDGRGRPEGAVVPPDITAPVLGAVGPKRRAYDDAAIVRAVTTGRNVEGRPLDPIMPRYRLTLADAGHLLAYLHQLGAAPDPGVTADRLVVGTVLARPDAPAGALLAAFFDRLDKAGGLFGRRVELAVAPAAATPTAAARQLLASRPVFALVAPWIARDEPAMAAFADGEDLPVVGAETLVPEAAGPAPHSLFFLDGGIPGEARALAIAAGRAGAGPVAIVEAGSFAGPAGAAAIAALPRAGPPPLRRTLAVTDTPVGLVRDLRDAGVGRILWLAPGLDGFAAAATAVGYRPALLAPAEFAGAADRDAGPLPVALGFRAGPADRTAEALAAYRDLAQAYHLPAEDQPGQWRALVAARLTVAALERAGHELTRERLLAALEATGDFRTGLMPPLAYGPSRRIGSTGTWVLYPGTAPEWIDPARK